MSTGFSMKKTISRFRDFFVGRSLLTYVCMAGIALGLIFAWTLVILHLTGDAPALSRSQKSINSFRQELAVFDSTALRSGYGDVEKLLRQLEKKAGSVEEWLSVLKRWRRLVKENKSLLPGYRSALVKALESFPHSPTTAAIAVEAAFLYGNADTSRADTSTDEQRFIPQRNYSAAESLVSGLDQSRYDSLRLCMFALNGVLADPLRTSSVSGADALFSVNLPGASAYLKNDMQLNGILLRILTGDKQSVPPMLNGLIAAEPDNADYLWIGAEYFYDNGAWLNSAGLFARLRGVSNISREADALTLSGNVDAARNIWIVLVSPQDEHASAQPVQLEIQQRAFYNLAAAADDGKEALVWLERLFAASNSPVSGTAYSSSVDIFGLVMYTRLQDTSRSIALLDGTKNPLLDLELLRRRMDVMPPEIWGPQIWLLVGRHPTNEDIYRWSAAYFDRYRQYGETAQLLKMAGNQNFSGGWIPLHRALALMREGKVDRAEEQLKEAQGKGGMNPWAIYANLGRIYESRRSIATAIDYYEAAAASAGDMPAAAVIWLRLSRCYDTMARFDESRRALERARKLDPDNINVRHELGRR